jgi:energy-converting hydrogenase Eha subunit H
VDIYSSKFAIIVIIVLVSILILQIMTNDNSNVLIDSETCELYIMDSQINAKQYLDEFDQKCLDFKSLNP